MYSRDVRANVAREAMPRKCLSAKERDAPPIFSSKKGELGYVGIALFSGSGGSSNGRTRLYYIQDKACDAESSWSEKV